MSKNNGRVIAVGCPVQYMTPSGEVLAAVVSGVYTKSLENAEPFLELKYGVAGEGCTMVDLYVMSEKGGFDLAYVPASGILPAPGKWNWIPSC
jgi:hypothetical protein